MRLSVHHATRFDFDQPSGHSIHDVRLTPKPASRPAHRVVAHRRAGQALRMARRPRQPGHDLLGGAAARPCRDRGARRLRIQRLRAVAALRRGADAARAVLAAQLGPRPPRCELRSADRRPRRKGRRPDEACRGSARGHEARRRRASPTRPASRPSRRRRSRRWRAAPASPRTTRMSSSPAAAGSACRRAMSAATCATTIPSCMSAAPATPGRRPGCPASNGWASTRPTTSARAATACRVAIGLDYRDAAPVSGRRVGFGDARMSVDAEVRLVG